MTPPCATNTGNVLPTGAGKILVYCLSLLLRVNFIEAPYQVIGSKAAFGYAIGSLFNSKIDNQKCDLEGNYGIESMTQYREKACEISITSAKSLLSTLLVASLRHAV